MSKVGIFLAEGLEEVEALTVVDICRRAGLEVTMISVTGKKNITGAHNISFLAEEVFEDIDFSEYNAVVLPGGMPGTIHLQEHEGVNRIVKEFAENGKLVAAICAAPSVLGKAGVLEGKTATIYPGCEAGIEGVTWTGENCVVEGNIITGKGPGVAMHFACSIVAYLVGERTAFRLQRDLMMP